VIGPENQKQSNLDDPITRRPDHPMKLSFALAFAKLRGGKGAAAGAAPPTGKCAGPEAWPIITRSELAGPHRQNQLSTALRTFTFLHNQA
jgi:hypothetical protein